MGLPSPERARTWGGKLVVDRDGAPIGTVTQIYTDDATGLPEWATTRLGEATVFLPLLDAHELDGAVQVQVKRDDVAKAPMVGPGPRISEQDEARLYRWYGIDYSPDRSACGLPAGTGPAPRSTPLQRLVEQGSGRRTALVVAATVAAAAAVVAVVVALFKVRRAGP